MANFTTLKELSEAKKHLVSCGYSIKKEKFKLNSRTVFNVKGDDGFEVIMTDYNLLSMASQ